MKKALLVVGMIVPYLAVHAQINSGNVKTTAKISTNLMTPDVTQDVTPVGNVARASLFTSDLTDTTLWVKGTQPGATGAWIFGAAPANIGGVVGVPTGAAAPYAYYNAIQYHPSQTGGTPNPTQNAWIVTADAIDLTAMTSSGIRVAFKQMYRPFNTDRVFVEIANATTPNTWVSSEVNTTVATNVNAPASVFANFDITGMDSIYVRFRFSGEPGGATQGGYGWAVDDIDIFELPAYDVKLVDPVAGLYTKYPLGQEDRDIALSVSAQNDGGSAQALSFEVKRGATSIATGTKTVNPAMLDTVEFATPFHPATGLGVSTLTYSATYDDVAATDTIVSLTNTIEVTANTFSKDRNQYVAGFDYAGLLVGPDGLPILNILTAFRTTAAANATSVSVMLGENSTAGSSFQVILYGVTQAGELEQIAESDIIPVVAADINTTTSTNPKMVRVDFFNEAIPLEPGEYWVSVENQGGDVGVAYHPLDIARDFEDDGGRSFLISTANGIDDLSGLIDGNTPAIRLNLNEAGVGVKENVASTSVAVFPNPTSDVVNVTMKDFSGMTQVKMYNMNGQEVYNDKVNVTSNSFVKTIDVSSFAAGVYTITLASDAGVSTVKVAVK